MDDMKRLIEKYKQELMEYSRAAAPKENLTFPEMIGENETAENMAVTAEPVEPVKPVENETSAEAVPDRESLPSDADMPPESEEMLNCQGESIPGTVYVSPQPPTEQPGEEADNVSAGEDYDELTPVTFGGEAENISDGQTSEPTETENVRPAVTENAPPMSGEPAFRDEEPRNPARKPEIIGYVGDNDGVFDYDSIFGDMLGEARVSDRRVTPADAPRHSDLPSQHGISVGNTEVSLARGNDLEFSGEISGVTDNSPQEPLPQSTPAGSVTPKRAERITERPVNGRPGEQLTGRSFENGGTAQNSRSDIRPLHDGNAPADLPPGSPAYSNLQDFVPTDEYEGDGESQQGNNFRFQVYTARNALPIKGALCVIMRKSNGGYVTLHRLITDISGQTNPVSLPAPSASLSQFPGNTVQPYALYDAEVSAEGYNTVEIKNIPVFEGVLSVQRVAMIPQTEESVTEIINEQETDMNGGK